MRVVISSLLGAVVGFTFMYVALFVEPEFDFLAYAFEGTIALLSLTLVNLIMTMVMMGSMYKKSKATLTGDAEDNRDEWLYKKYTDTNMVSTGAIVTAIATLSISIITNQSFWLIVTPLVAIIVVSVLSVILASLLNSFYPNRELPGVSEKNYATKLLAASDEGERHVMLEGLYKSYTLLNTMLLGSMAILLVYSIFTGSSQLFAIFFVGVVLLVSNARYYLSIRNQS